MKDYGCWLARLCVCVCKTQFGDDDNNNKKEKRNLKKLPPQTTCPPATHTQTNIYTDWPINGLVAILARRSDYSLLLLVSNLLCKSLAVPAV